MKSVRKIKNITNIITLKNNVPILASKLPITKVKINNPIKYYYLFCSATYYYLATTKMATAKVPVSPHPSSQHNISQQVANHSPNTSQSGYTDLCI